MDGRRGTEDTVVAGRWCHSEGSSLASRSETDDDLADVDVEEVRRTQLLLGLHSGSHHSLIQ